MQAIEALLRRYSARALKEPAPDDAALGLILESATRAADHGLLRPWRFIVIRSEDRAQFGELLAGHLRRTKASASDEALERERRKAFRAPLIVVVAAIVTPESKIPRDRADSVRGGRGAEHVTCRLRARFQRGVEDWRTRLRRAGQGGPRIGVERCHRRFHVHGNGFGRSGRAAAARLAEIRAALAPDS